MHRVKMWYDGEVLVIDLRPLLRSPCKGLRYVNGGIPREIPTIEEFWWIFFCFLAPPPLCAIG